VTNIDVIRARARAKKAKEEAQSQEVALPEFVRGVIQDSGPPVGKGVDQYTWWDKAKGVGEVALSMIEGAPLAIIGADAALISRIYHSGKSLGEEIYGNVTGEEYGVDEMVETLDWWLDMAYRPNSAKGKEYMQALGDEFEKFHKDVRRGGEYLAFGAQGGAGLSGHGEIPGLSAIDESFEGLGPAAGAALEAISEAPPILGRGSVREMFKRRGDIRAVKGKAERAGISLSESKEAQTAGLAEHAKVLSGGFKRGAAMRQLVESVIRAKEVARRYVRKMYTAATGEQAVVANAPAAGRDLFAMIDESLKGYPDDMPRIVTAKKQLGKMLDEAEAQGGYLELNEAEFWRRSLGKKAPGGDDTQNAMLGIMKGQYDNWLDAQFAADMILGTPEVLEKWKAARLAHSRYRAQFKEDKVIRNMAETNATPETVRKWLFSAAKVGFSAEAASIVQRVKAIRGVDSDSMAALRTDASLNLMRPLLKADISEADLSAFVSNYDQLVMDNPSLFKELFTSEQYKELRDLSNAVRKSKKLLVQSPADLVARVVGVFSAGHQLARRALMVTGVTRGVRAIMGFGGEAAPVGQKAQILMEMLGYDPYVPLLPRTPPMIEAMAQTAKNQAEEQ